MATENTEHHGGLPLESFNKNTHRVGDPATTNIHSCVTHKSYNYGQITDLPEYSIGLAICGRLRGSVFQYASKMSTTRYAVPDGVASTVSGNALLVLVSVPAFIATDGTDYELQEHGGSLLIRSLRDEFGVVAQESCVASLDAWDDLAIPRNMHRTDFLLM